jgi:hypothetical protein
VTQNPNVLFLAPVTEEVLQVTSKLNTKISAGYDEIPDMIVNNVFKLLTLQRGDLNSAAVSLLRYSFLPAFKF